MEIQDAPQIVNCEGKMKLVASHRDTQEPMLRFNGTGWGVRWSTIIQASVVLFTMISAWMSLQNQIQNLTNKTIEYETTREQIMKEIRELQKYDILSAVERARLQEQVSNISLLLGDIRREFRLYRERTGIDLPEENNPPDGVQVR